ncbi:uncharacterized protein B0H18DRAFT_1031587, partial [Fomitopsis serialis]|uniref:uncharacterized protein n=1 Tax=Fomitopsis serialis TaxID=139415 RepID=UPI002007A731
MTEQERAASVLGKMKKGRGGSLESSGTPHPHAGSSSSAQQSRPGSPPLIRPTPIRPQTAGSHPRGYDLDGELFIRTTEDASMVERELLDGLVERGYYDDLLSRDLEARNNADPESPHQRAEREAREHAQRAPQRNAQYMQAAGETLFHFAQHGYPGQSRGPYPPEPHPWIGRTGQHGGAGHGAGAQHHPRDYDLDGELLERDFEAYELD